MKDTLFQAMLDFKFYLLDFFFTFMEETFPWIARRPK